MKKLLYYYIYHASLNKKLIEVINIVIGTLWAKLEPSLLKVSKYIKTDI
jgi:hypothetical protein